MLSRLFDTGRMLGVWGFGFSFYQPPQDDDSTETENYMGFPHIGVYRNRGFMGCIGCRAKGLGFRVSQN